jgi:hypothetical protein
MSITGPDRRANGSELSQPGPVSSAPRSDAKRRGNSGAPAPLRGLRPAEGPTTTARARGGLGLIATIRQQVLRVRRDPDIGQERLQVHLLR